MSKEMRLILGSGSPRRRELLTAAGFTFDVRIPEIDETPRRQEHPKNMVKRLALEKAGWIAQTVFDEEFRIIVAADTTVVSPKNKNLGKPESRSEAVAMLCQLQGKTHSVYTGYALFMVRKGKVIKKISRVVQTKVTFRPLSKKEIEAYVDRGESMDKAGAYAAQGAGVSLVEKMNGSYTNVVGLPLSEVIQDLKRMTQT